MRIQINLSAICTYLFQSEVRLLALVGNFGVRTLVSVLGSKNSLYFCMFFHVFGSMLLIHFEQFWVTALAIFFIGANNQLVNNVLKITMTDLFDDQFIHYLPICYSGYAFGPLILPIIFTYMINPENQTPSLEFYENGSVNHYFGGDIIHNFIQFQKLQLLFYFLVIIMCLYPLEDTSRLSNKLLPIIRNTISGKFSQAKEMILQNRRTLEIQETVSHSFQITPLEENGSLIFNMSRKSAMKDLHISPSKHFSFTKLPKWGDRDTEGLEQILIQKMENQTTEIPSSSHIFKKKTNAQNDYLTETVPEEIELKEIPSPQKEEPESLVLTKNEHPDSQFIFSSEFIKYFFICLTRATAVRWFLSNFKVLGLYFFKDDRLVSLIGSMSYVSYIAQSFSFGSIYGVLGLNGSYILLLGSLVLALLLYGFNLENMIFYIFLSLVLRVSL
jgi:hypothetical protein